MSPLLRKIYETSPKNIYRFFADRKRQAKARHLINEYILSHTVRKLHVGCGGNFFKGWLNSDIFPDNEEIITLDASKPFPIPSETFDYVYSEHLFEHLTFEGQVNFLRESFKILKPDGKIRIATPDFSFLAKLAGNEKSTFEKNYLKWNFQNFLKHIPAQLMDESNLEVYVINNYFRDWGHQLIHNKSSISNLLAYCGFLIIGFQSVGDSSDPLLQGLEHHGAMITETYNKYETMVIEAIKPGGKSKNG